MVSRIHLCSCIKGHSFSLLVWLLLSLAEAEFENISKYCWELLCGHAWCTWAEYLVLQTFGVINNYNLCKLWGFCSCVAEHSILGFEALGSVISQKKQILDYNWDYWEKGNLGELDLNILHCPCVLSLFIKIQLKTLRLYTPCYCILQYFWHVLARIRPSRGRQIQGNICTSLQVAQYMCLLDVM
jgi:hypothetical protein